MGEFTFKRSERIHRKKDFERILREGKRFRGKGFTLVVLKRRGLPERRIGIVVSKKLKGAVKRNRAKRLVREFFRLNKERFPAPADTIVILYRFFRDYWEVRDLFTPFLEEVKERLGEEGG